MRRILVINPITNDCFGGTVQEYLEGIKSPHVEVEVASVERGPSSIETFYDEAFAMPGILKLVDEWKSRCDAIVINCFADPAVHAARESADIPVVGPAEASMSLALTLGHRFGVVSTFNNSGPWIELQARALGIEDRLAGAVGVDIPVLELGDDLGKTARYLVDAAKDLIASKGAEVIVLGCTGMAPVAAMIRGEIEVPVVEPLSAAYKTAELLVDLGLRHSRGGLYMPASREKISGYIQEADKTFLLG